MWMCRPTHARHYPVFPKRLDGKLRWADPKRGKGRRGGLRLIYYYFAGEQQIWLMTLYDKDEAPDLTPKEKQALKSAIETELRPRQSAKRARQRKSKR